MSKKSFILCIIGILLVSFCVYTFITDFNMTSLANDSGFDVDYGGSSSSSSSDWGSSSSSYRSGSGGGSGDIFGFGENLLMGSFILVVFWYTSSFSKKQFIISAICVGLLIITRLFLVVFIIFCLLVIPVSLFMEGRSKPIKRKRLTLNVDPVDKPLLDEGYQIFKDVQIAWMNFDYDKLRELVTDDLYNMYYNQLQTLNIKGQKNIMSDFDLVGYRLKSRQTDNNGNTIICMELNVKFHDYIVNQKGRKIKGYSKEKVDMTYELTFIYNDNAINACPNCNAPLEDSKTICEHCNTHIHTTRSKMKLSNKIISY